MTEQRSPSRTSAEQHSRPSDGSANLNSAPNNPAGCPRHPEGNGFCVHCLRLQPNAPVPCPDCGGEGEYGTTRNCYGEWDTKQCPTCDGMGEVLP